MAHGEFPMIRWQRERKHRSVLKMVLHGIQTPPENGQLQHYNPFLGQLWKTVVTGNLPMEQNFRRRTWLFAMLGGRNGQTCYQFMGCGWWLSWMVREVERTWKLMIKKYGEVARESTSLNGQINVKVCELHVNTHKRVTSAGDDFNNQLDRMFWRGYQSLFPVTLVIIQLAYEKIATVAGTEVMHVLSNMDVHSLTITWPLKWYYFLRGLDNYLEAGWLHWNRQLL